MSRTALGLAAALVTAASPLILPAPAQAAITPTSSAAALGAALQGPGANLTGSSFTTVSAAGANGVADSALSSFPTNGPSFAILTSGSAESADDANTNDPDGGGGADDKTTDNGGGAVRGDTDRDVSILKLDLDVPATANCLSFDFQFYSEEYFDFVGTEFNDAFIAELDSSTWTTSGSNIGAPDNFAFDGAHNVVSVNATGIGTATARNAAGTTYDAATELLSAAHQVTPGSHSLYLSIFDQGDNILDSAAFVDNLRVGFVPDPATQCVPGAHVKQFQLDLTPPTATKETGQTHTVTATLQDLNATPPAIPGATILFQTTGVNPGTGSGTTDAAGQTTYSYVGANVGSDTISACYDLDTSGTCDAGEPFASATVEWTNAPPTNDAGGPYAGDEGSNLSLTGSASDVNAGDTLTNTWSIAPGAGVDVGASCSFADANDLTTTVSCTDDGTWDLTLTTNDGVNPDVVATTTVTVDNVDPEITGITVSIAPVALGTPVSFSATYTDPGANDTHTASIDWGDGSTTAPAASGGSVADSHVYTAAGIYTICLTVTDDDLGSDTECAEDYVVVYDPNGGFVTGGGWITAAPGSFPADPSVSGPGRFGFVSKYHKGATVPVGNTEFQFQAGDLNFHSESYEWLVVAGTKAVYKGAGTVNGEAGYRFIVSAIDGGKTGPDRFRIKIWNASTDVVVFDNQAGASDDASATNAITQGSIVIHK